MKKRVCPGDGKANTRKGTDIAISPDDLEMATFLGIVPDEVLALGKTHVTHDEMHLYNMDTDMLEMSEGMTIWRAIGFALERDLELPHWVRQYLVQTAEALEDWAAENGHPSELKAVLRLSGKRKATDPVSDPRWVFQEISRMKESDPSKSIKSLTGRICREYALVQSEEAIRQKYYEGKKLVETGIDYKGRGRIKEAPPHTIWNDNRDIEEF